MCATCRCKIISISISCHRGMDCGHKARNWTSNSNMSTHQELSRAFRRPRGTEDCGRICRIRSTRTESCSTISWKTGPSSISAWTRSRSATIRGLWRWTAPSSTTLPCNHSCPTLSRWTKWISRNNSPTTFRRRQLRRRGVRNSWGNNSTKY